MHARAQRTGLAALGVLASVTWVTVHALLQDRAVHALMHPQQGHRVWDSLACQEYLWLPKQGCDHLQLLGCFHLGYRRPLKN